MRVFRYGTKGTGVRFCFVFERALGLTKTKRQLLTGVLRTVTTTANINLSLTKPLCKVLVLEFSKLQIKLQITYNHPTSHALEVYQVFQNLFKC